MVMAWYIRSSVWRVGVNGLEASGREVDAEWEEGCIVDLPFSAFRKSLKIDCGPIPLVPGTLDSAFTFGTTIEGLRYQ